MARFQEVASWLLSSLGLALLVCSLVLVPTNTAMGDTPTQPTQCPGNVCDLGCVAGNACWNLNCPVGGQCLCSAASVPPVGVCAMTCECKVGTSDCFCGTK